MIRYRTRTTLLPALQGTDGDIARAHARAMRSVDRGSTQLASITQPTERPGELRSVGCPT